MRNQTGCIIFIFVFYATWSAVPGLALLVAGKNILTPAGTLLSLKIIFVYPIPAKDELNVRASSETAAPYGFAKSTFSFVAASV
ncbi:MAG: hypothetical protein QM737_07990 [Ferruginibacter sp.]